MKAWAAVLLAAAAALATAPGTTTPIRQKFGVRIEMRDGIALSANVFLPPAEEPAPAILVRTAYGKGSALWKYWTEGEGKAKWIGAVHKWRTLRALLIKEHVPLHMVDGLTTNIISHVLPSYMATTHEKSG